MKTQTVIPQVNDILYYKRNGSKHKVIYVNERAVVFEDDSGRIESVNLNSLYEFSTDISFRIKSLENEIDIGKQELTQLMVRVQKHNQKIDNLTKELSKLMGDSDGKK